MRVVQPSEGPRPLRVGLTGSIGSGKSTVARMLEERGAAVVDADVLAREATSDPAVLAQIAAELGAELVIDGPDGPRLDRAATAKHVFGDGAARAKLNAIVHPWVRQRSAEITRELEALPEPPRVIVYDVPLLYESGLEGDYDLVVVVDAPLKLRELRLAQRSGMEPAEVARREAAQVPASQKTARADHVLVNAGGVEELSGQVDRLWSDLTA